MILAIIIVGVLGFGVVVGKILIERNKIKKIMDNKID